MKKLLAVLSLLVCFNVNSQYTADNGYLTTNVVSTTMSTNINLRLNLGTSRGYRYNSDTKVGPYLLLGGGVFVLTGLLTPTTYVGGSTTLKKPFAQQMRNWVMITGGVMGTVGLVITISGN
jgi:hypothetical protein